MTVSPKSQQEKVHDEVIRLSYELLNYLTVNMGLINTDHLHYKKLGLLENALSEFIHSEN